MKGIICIVFLVIITQCCFAQSARLKNSYNEVASTLKDYKFQSEDVHKCNYNMYETKSITIKLSDGKIVFTLNDQYIDWGDHSEAHPGIKTVTVPIREAKFDIGTGFYSTDKYVIISGNNGVEHKYKDKKELLKSYSIYSSELTIKKLHQDLSNLVEIAKSEYFNGTLGSTTKSSGNTKKSTSQQNSKSEAKSSTTTPKSSTSQQKKAGRYVQ